MNRAEYHTEPNHNGLGHRTLSHKGSARYIACVILTLTAIWAPFVLADAQTYEYVDPARLVSPTNVPISPPVAAIHRKTRYHSGVANLELEQAVIRAAEQHHVQPALLLAVMKAESSFNPIVISKAGAVGLMQLVPETAIRHGVRHLYDTNENITGGAKHLRYLLDRFHGNTRLALAAYNAGERKVDRYGKIPPYKETQDYVKKVLVYYRGYKKDGWVMPVVIAAPSMHAGRPY
ncbi:MAG: lytic transglycosylase domain-containing protein [Nitrospiraceae bacterium]|nr:lytic transglycosylase domain-containing protein [Nitrospiraceae bacterium]